MIAARAVTGWRAVQPPSRLCQMGSRGKDEEWRWCSSNYSFTLASSSRFQLPDVSLRVSDLPKFPLEKLNPISPYLSISAFSNGTDVDRESHRDEAEEEEEEETTSERGEIGLRRRKREREKRFDAVVISSACLNQSFILALHLYLILPAPVLSTRSGRSPQFRYRRADWS